MAAVDTFWAFLNELHVTDKERLGEFIKQQREQLLAARSEEARVRIVQNFMAEAHDRLKKN